MARTEDKAVGQMDDGLLVSSLCLRTGEPQTGSRSGNSSGGHVRATPSKRGGRLSLDNDTLTMIYGDEGDDGSDSSNKKQ